MTYDFSSSHVDVPEPIAGEILSWGKKNITDSEIFVSQTDPGFGREDEMHATVLYGIHSPCPDQTEKLIKGHKPIGVQLGKVKVFTNPLKFDVVVVDVISHDLRALNDRLTKEIEHTNRYGGYRPHITVAYVQKGKGWQHNGVDLWAGQKFEANYLVFSSVNGTKKRIEF